MALIDILLNLSVVGAVLYGIYLLYRFHDISNKDLKNIPPVPWSEIIFQLIRGLTFIEAVDEVIPLCKYFSIRRIFFAGKWEVINSDPELLRKILYNTNEFDKLTPHQFAPNSLMDNMFGKSVLFSGNKDWKKFRKIVNPAFKKGWNLHVFSECVEEMFMGLGDGDIRNLDIGNLVQRVTTEALGRELMDVKFGVILSAQEHKFISFFNDIMCTALDPAYFIFPGLDKPWNPLRIFAYRKLDYVNNYFDSILKDRKKKISEHPNFVYKDVLSLMLTSSMNDKNGLTDEEVKYNTLMFFLAGQDTTTFTICSILHLLAEHPEVQVKVREEVLRVFGKDEYETGKFQIPTSTQLSQLEFTYAVIQESMRLYPAVTVLTHRVPTVDVEYKGYIIPKGTTVDTCIYAIHRNPEYFKDPNTFNPSRFLNNNIDTTKFESNWFSFSSGNRTCLGSQFAITQIKIVVSYILRRYKIKPSFGPPMRRTLKVEKPFLLKTKNLKLDFEIYSS